MSYDKQALALHKKYKGKVAIRSKVPLRTKNDLSVYYTPGVAAPSRAIQKNKQEVYTYTNKGNMVAVLTDGSAVLGLGNIGAEASLPVMEGKAVLFKQFAGIDAFPVAVDSQDTNEIIRTAQLIAPMFGGINLEDISSPRCFEIEEKLDQLLDIPVFHDDQHGTAIVVLAGLLNALRIIKKRMIDLKIVISGAGAAGIAITRLLQGYPQKPKEIILVDSRGTVYEGRNNLNPIKKSIAKITNKQKQKGDIHDALVGADAFIGVSKGGILTAADVRAMSPQSIIFAMANPVPEIMPSEAKKSGAAVVATGRSDFSNQVNNVLVFPGIFRGSLDARAKTVSKEMKYAAALALSQLVKKPTSNHILPSPFDRSVSSTIARSVMKTAKK